MQRTQELILHHMMDEKLLNAPVLMDGAVWDKYVVGKDMIYRLSLILRCLYQKLCQIGKINCYEFTTDLKLNQNDIFENVILYAELKLVANDKFIIVVNVPATRIQFATTLN